MKTIKIALIVCLSILGLFSCEKDDLPQPYGVSSNEPFLDSETIDPEIIGNDELDQPKGEQTDFLFDTSNGRATLNGATYIEMLDEMADNPIIDFINYEKSIDLFEPNHPDRKVASVLMNIKEITTINYAQMEVKSALKFDFGHGSILADATFICSNSGNHTSIALQNLEIQKVTRHLNGREKNMLIKGFTGVAQELNDYTTEISIQFSLEMN